MEFKLEKLRREVQVGVEQLNNGQYATYNAQAFKERFEQIKAQGRKCLAEPSWQKSA